MNFEFGFLRCGLKLCLQTGRIIGALTPGGLWLPVLLVTFSVHATTYYIATNGNNNYDGLAAAYDGTHGPKQNFRDLMYSETTYTSGCTLVPGDVVYVEGGTYDHTGDGVDTALRLSGAYGTQANPITISNYPGQYPVIYGSGPNANTIYLFSCSWVRIIGINETNAYRGAEFSSVRNCEIAYCDIGGGNTNLGYLQPFSMDTSSQSNWVHNCTVHDALAQPVGDSTHCMTFGLFFSTTDFTAYNIIESNTCYHAGHDVLSIYGPYNLVRNNFIHDENWYFRDDLQTNSAHRCVEIGGSLGYGNVFENNRVQYAGFNYNTPHGLELDGPDANIIRRNVFYGNSYSGLTIYGAKVGSSHFWGSNYVSGNTIALNGFGQRYITLFNAGVPYQTNDVLVWKPAVTVANTTNNFFVNNVFSDNYADGVWGAGESFATAVIDYRGNTNYSMATAKYADTNDGGAWSSTQPNFALTSSSPAIDAGTWLTTITSASGSGTSFNVANAGWFFAGLTAAGHTVPGDTIQLQGQTGAETITAISGNTITVNSSLTWTNGQGVSLSYSGSAPDVGAFEYSNPVTSQVAPPSGLTATAFWVQ